jgi:hypothetical protein
VIPEADLIAAIRVLAIDPARRMSMAKYVPATVPLPPPVTWDVVRAAEARLGFPLPAMFGRLFVEIGNGGFGPGYGLFGLAGGHVDDVQGLTLDELYIATIEDSAWETFLETPWPRRLMPVCDWGCQHLSAIDCSTPEGEVVDLADGYLRKPRRRTFAEWMEDWVRGVDIAIST